MACAPESVCPPQDGAEDEKSEEVKSFERTFAKKNKQEEYAHELSLVPDQKVDKVVR